VRPIQEFARYVLEEATEGELDEIELDLRVACDVVKASLRVGESAHEISALRTLTAMTKGFPEPVREETIYSWRADRVTEEELGLYEQGFTATGRRRVPSV
jgi:hypothetical protein